MPSFFKLVKNKQFNYIPRHYNEQQDEMLKRKERIAKEIQKEDGNNDENKGIIFKEQIKNHYRQYAESNKKQYNIRLLAILAVLLLLAYFLLIK